MARECARQQHSGQCGNRQINVDFDLLKRPLLLVQVITYNFTTGAVIGKSSEPQGLGLNTVWSRGQVRLLPGGCGQANQ